MEVYKNGKSQKIFPLSIQGKNSTKELIINVLIHVVVNVVSGIIFGLLGGIPLIGWLFDIVGFVVGLYFSVSVILSLLDYFKVLK